MVTVILPVEEVKELGNVMSHFLKEDGEDLVDILYDISFIGFLEQGYNEEQIVQVKAIIRKNILDTLVIVCLDNLIDKLGTEGFGKSVIEAVNGKVENEIVCRFGHIEILFTSDVADTMEDSLFHYDIYRELGSYIERHVRDEEKKAMFRTSLLTTLGNLSAYGDINMRDVISTTIVDGQSLLLFLRDELNEGES